MMKSKLQPRTVDENEWVFTILGLAILFGIFVRILPVLSADFPINDGGMFAVMMRDLQTNKFLLPTYTTYNFSNIPFAYPPFGFYIGAFLQLFGINDLQLLIWLPAIFTSATIPLFYFLVFELTENRLRAAVATVFFALTPGNYVWLLMGGGLTRALGTLFVILAIYFVYRSYKETNWRTTISAIVFCSLTVLSHPQTALIAVVSSFIFLLFFIRSRNSILHAFVIAFGTLVVTSPWWVTMILKHGFDIFLSVSQSGNLDISTPYFLSQNLFSIQTIVPVTTFFRILGFMWVIYKRRFDLLIWGFSLFFIDQRSASILTSFLFPILSAFGLVDVLPAFIHWIRKRKWIIQTDEILFNHRALSMSLLGIIFYLFIECSFHTFLIRSLILPPEARQMMSWIQDNTFLESKFLILTRREDVMTDPLQEWFPALAERHSETTLQGLEWVLHREFQNRWDELAILQRCENLECVNMQAQDMNLEFTYLVLDKSKISVESFLSTKETVLFENSRYIIISK